MVGIHVTSKAVGLCLLKKNDQIIVFYVRIWPGVKPSGWRSGYIFTCLWSKYRPICFLLSVYILSISKLCPICWYFKHLVIYAIKSVDSSDFSFSYTARRMVFLRYLVCKSLSSLELPVLIFLWNKNFIVDH